MTWTRLTAVPVWIMGVLCTAMVASGADRDVAIQNALGAARDGPRWVEHPEELNWICERIDGLLSESLNLRDVAGASAASAFLHVATGDFERAMVEADRYRLDPAVPIGIRVYAQLAYAYGLYGSSGVGAGRSAGFDELRAMVAEGIDLEQLTHGQWGSHTGSMLWMGDAFEAQFAIGMIEHADSNELRVLRAYDALEGMNDSRRAWLDATAAGMVESIVPFGGTSDTLFSSFLGSQEFLGQSALEIVADDDVSPFDPDHSKAVGSGVVDGLWESLKLESEWEWRGKRSLRSQNLASVMLHGAWRLGDREFVTERVFEVIDMVEPGLQIPYEIGILAQEALNDGDHLSVEVLSEATIHAMEVWYPDELDHRHPPYWSAKLVLARSYMQRGLLEDAERVLFEVERALVDHPELAEMSGYLRAAVPRAREFLDAQWERREKLEAALPVAFDGRLAEKIGEQRARRASEEEGASDKEVGGDEVAGSSGGDEGWVLLAVSTSLIVVLAGGVLWRLRAGR